MFRWFVGLGIDDQVWNHSTFSKNRDRLMAHRINELLFDAVKKQAYAKQLMSRDHFTVDGTLLDACAGMKSFKPTSPDDNDSDGSGSGENFHGEKRSNKTHESTTDPDARLYRKGKGKACAPRRHAARIRDGTRRAYWAWRVRSSCYVIPVLVQTRSLSVWFSGQSKCLGNLW